jgi:hypothetical protein
MAGARHCMCVLRALHGRGKAWAWHGHGMLCVNRRLCSLIRRAMNKIRYVTVYFVHRNRQGHRCNVGGEGEGKGINAISIFFLPENNFVTSRKLMIQLGGKSCIIFSLSVVTIRNW